MFMENETKKIKPIVTSRLLFISALDKIYLVILGLTLLSLTIINFSGRISSPYYNFWGRVGIEVIILIALFILYLLLNWFYKCAVKTVLCLTENQVYKEKYIPFKRTEISIPLNRITKVSIHTAFWIFRVIIIHQYHQLPMFFFTWNHQQFKDELNKLLVKEEKVENIYETKNILSKKGWKVVMWIGVGLAGLIASIGIVRLFNVIFTKPIDITGTYSYYGDIIEIRDDNTCNIDDIIYDDVTKCTWRFNEETGSLVIDYEYEDYSYYFGYETEEDTLYLDYDYNNDALVYGYETYTRQ